jgi:hypothetical protein
MGRKWGKNDINRPKLIMDVPAGQTSPKCGSVSLVVEIMKEAGIRVK